MPIHIIPVEVPVQLNSLYSWGGNNSWGDSTVELPIELGFQYSWGASTVGGACTVGYNEFDFFLENEEHRPFDKCKIEI